MLKLNRSGPLLSWLLGTYGHQLCPVQNHLSADMQSHRVHAIWHITMIPNSVLPESASVLCDITSMCQSSRFLLGRVVVTMDGMQIAGCRDGFLSAVVQQSPLHTHSRTEWQSSGHVLPSTHGCVTH